MPADFTHLGSVLRRHSELDGIVQSLQPGRLSEQKKAMLQAVSPRVKRFLAGDVVAVRAWDEFMRGVGDGVLLTFESNRRQVVAATLLAGEALTTPALALRPGLAPALYQARAALLGEPIAVAQQTVRGQPGLPTRIAHPAQALPPAYAKVLREHDILLKHASAQGKLRTAIRALLTDSKRSLGPLGTMRTLDCAVIDAARESQYLQPSARVQQRFVDRVEETDAFAPSTLAVRLKDFQCLRQQEDGGDQVFWAGNFVSCANLEEVVDAIDRFFQRDPVPKLDQLDLRFKWEHSSFVRPEEGELYQCKSNEDVDHAHSFTQQAVFQQTFVRGFGPWAGVVFAIEDDDAEYDAVNEVVSQVGDYADEVGMVASTVSAGLAAGGVTGLAAVATGAVATAAEVVSIGADVLGAVVDIVNFFDTNDMIGSVDLSDPGDYAVRDQSAVFKGDVPDTEDLYESPTGAHYRLRLAISYGPTALFKRSWSCRKVHTVFPLDGGWFDRSGGVFGDDNDEERTVDYEPPVHLLEAYDLEEKESAEGHAEVLGDYPRIENSGSRGRVKWHWGISAFNSFRFKIVMDGYRFDDSL